MYIHVCMYTFTDHLQQPWKPASTQQDSAAVVANRRNSVKNSQFLTLLRKMTPRLTFANLREMPTR